MTLLYPYNSMNEAIVVMKGKHYTFYFKDESTKA